MIRTIKPKLLILLALVIATAICGVATAEGDLYVEEFVDLSEIGEYTHSDIYRAYLDHLTYGEAMTYRSASAGLDDVTKSMYSKLSAHVTRVADGETELAYLDITYQELNQMGIVTDYAPSDLGVEVITEFETVLKVFAKQYDTSTIMFAMMCDMPYDMYWFDKTIGMRQGYGGTYLEDGSSVRVTWVRVVFGVIERYRATDYNPDLPMVDTSVTSSTVTAVNNAKAIVQRATTLSDYSKLVYYKRAICDLASYNEVVSAPDYVGGYGDEWQLVYVFDGNPSTSVVCEGYSKAFQYLCNLTRFVSPTIQCNTVTGNFRVDGTSSGHMWNIVTMEDGKHYLVDVTNSESNAIGRNGRLFLGGVTGNVSSGYVAMIGTRASYYTYDDATLSLWGTGDDSILVLSDLAYRHTIEIEPDVYVESFDQPLSEEGLTGDAIIIFAEFEGEHTDYGIAITDGVNTYVYEGKRNNQGKYAIALFDIPHGRYAIVAYADDEMSDTIFIDYLG